MAVTKKNEWIVGLLIALGTIVLIFILVSFITQRTDYEGPSPSSRGDKIAVIELFGPIYDSKHIVSQFKLFAENKSIKAILFRIDSPGGSVAASQEIYDAVKRAREKKPVIASMGTVAASGGYYVACGADTIMAVPGTTTGSIGVIAQFITLERILQKAGVRFETIKSGAYKDTGSPYRDMTPADRFMLQSWVDDAYQQFVEVVSTERAIPLKKIKGLADGRVFTGRQAMAAGLVDILGDYEDAVLLAASMGGIEGTPVVVKERRARTTIFDLFFEQARELLRGLGRVHLTYSMN